MPDSEATLAERFNEGLPMPPEVPTTVPVLIMPMAPVPSSKARSRAWRTIQPLALAMLALLIVGAALLFVLLWQ